MMIRVLWAMFSIGLLSAPHLVAAEPPTIDESKYQLPGADLSVPAWVGMRPDEPFDVKGFLESRRPPTENAAPLYLYALSQFSYDFLFLLTEAERTANEAKIREFEKRTGDLSDSEKFKQRAQAGELEQYCREAQPYLELIDQAQQRPQCLFVTGYGIDTLLPHCQAARSVARMNAIVAANACAKGDFATANQCLARSLRISRDLRPRGHLISQLVSCAIDTIAINVLLENELGSSQLTVADCDEIIRLLTLHLDDPIDMNVEGLRMEYVMMGELLKSAEAGKIEPKGIGLEKLGKSFAAVNFPLEWETTNQLMAVMLRMAAQSPSRQNFTRKELDQRMQELQVQVMNEQNSLLSSTLKATGLGRLHTPVITVTMIPAVFQFCEATRRQKTRVEGARLLTAVRRYQLKHGKLPASLEVAAREAGLKGVAVDPYDPAEQPLRYTVLDGKPVVYSVAADGKDDGGKIDWKFNPLGPGDFLFQLP